MVVCRAEEQNQLQLVEREEMDDEDDLFEAIDKCKLQIMSSFSLCTDCFSLSILDFLRLFCLLVLIHVKMMIALCVCVDS